MEDRFTEGLLVGSNGNNGMFGGEWGGLIGLLIVASLFGGGWGNGFGNRGGSCATQADLSAGFANSEIMSDLNDIILGQSTMQNFINQGFAGLNSSISTLGYQNQAGFNALSTQIAQCCCDTRSAISDLKYANEKQTCDILASQNAQTRAILDYLTSEKISSLQAENTALKGQLSDDRQADRIINKLSPCPSPAYVVPNPNCCYQYGVYQMNSCNCNC